MIQVKQPRKKWQYGKRPPSNCEPFYFSRFCGVALCPGPARFEEPIELPDGRKLKTLAEAIAWLAKEIPKSEHKMEKVQTAAHLVTRAAEHGGPMIFAQMGMLQAIHRRRERVFNPDRKDHHWGKRKLKRDE